MNSWTRLTDHKSHLLSLLLVVGLMTGSSLTLGLKVHDLQGLQMDMDEAVHATRGLDISSAIVRGSLADLWFHTSKPHLYPPGHGFMLGGWFLVVGASVYTARLYSTLSYFFLGLLLWFSAKKAIPHSNPMIYLVPPLFLAADPLHVIHGGMSMLEVPAILQALASLFFFNLARQSNRFRDHFLAALFGLACFFTKYNYGLVVFATLLLCYAPFAFGQLRKRTWKTVLLAWLPTVAALIVWLLGLGEWRWLKAYASAQPAVYKLWTEANLMYYPKLLWTEPLGWLGLILLGVGLAYWAKQRSLDPSLVPYFIFFGIGLVTLTYKLKNEPRFGMMLFPPVWLGAAASAATIAQRLRNRVNPSLIGGVLILLLAGAAIENHSELGPRLRAEYENTNEDVDAAYQFVADTLGTTRQQSAAIVMLGRADQWNGTALRFRLESQCVFSTGCTLSVLDDKDISQGWPRQNFPPQVETQRYETALQEADFVVLFSASFAERDQWERIAERGFTFEQGDYPALPVQVTIWTRKVTQP